MKTKLLFIGIVLGLFLLNGCGKEDESFNNVTFCDLYGITFGDLCNEYYILSIDGQDVKIEKSNDKLYHNFEVFEEQDDSKTICEKLDDGRFECSPKMLNYTVETYHKSKITYKGTTNECRLIENSKKLMLLTNYPSNLPKCSATLYRDMTNTIICEIKCYGDEFIYEN